MIACLSYPNGKQFVCKAQTSVISHAHSQSCVGKPAVWLHVNICTFFLNICLRSGNISASSRLIFPLGVSVCRLARPTCAWLLTRALTARVAHLCGNAATTPKRGIAWRNVRGTALHPEHWLINNHLAGLWLLWLKCGWEPLHSPSWNIAHTC